MKGVNEMYPYDEPLTEEQMREYSHRNCLDLWNPSVIDNDPNLTDSQKQQLKDYNRIWGD